MSLRDRFLAAYRRTGAEPPGGDPRPTHGAEMEGYFWRFTDAGSGRVVVALCGVNQSARGPWATVAVAAHPGRFVRSAAVEGATADASTYRVHVPGVLDADERHVRVDMGAGAKVEATFDADAAFRWPLRTGGGGVFSVLPYLGQYWHPHLLDGRADVTAMIAGETWTMAGARAYAEKNWGRGFPEYWWWGQANAFDDGRDGVSVVFTGGVLDAGPLAAVVGGIVVRVGRELVRLTPPLARIRTEVAAGRWMMTGRGHGWTVEIDGQGEPAQAHVLPVPVPAENRNVDTDFEHLAGRLTLRVRRGTDIVYEGTSHLAGLEVGTRPGVTGPVVVHSAGLRPFRRQ
ncbi:MAG TPA: tocopherol cyclase family protein [Acidimicrobiales bacterium]